MQLFGDIQCCADKIADPDAEKSGEKRLKGSFALTAEDKTESPSARCPGVSLLLGAASSAPSGRGSGVLISTSSSSVRASAVVSVSPGLF